MLLAAGDSSTGEAAGAQLSPYPLSLFSYDLKSPTGDGLDPNRGDTLMTNDPTRHALDSISFPSVDISDLASDPRVANPARNIAVLRTSLRFLYEAVKSREDDLPPGPHSIQDFDVNTDMALVAGFFDWFSVGMLNLMGGVSLLDTLVREQEAYTTLCARPSWMKRVREQVSQYTDSIPEAKPLRLWRNKVAAHRSGIMPPPGGREDSVTTKLVSLIGATVMAQNGRYVAPGMTPGGSWNSSNDQLPEWSLTQTWELLREDRYTWLDDDELFVELGYTLGGTTKVYRMEVRSGDGMDDWLRAMDIELP